jgi:hypothetical protein
VEHAQYLIIELQRIAELLDPQRVGTIRPLE